MDLTIPCFDPALIARSGQCFRMREGKGGIVTALAGADRVRVTPLGGDRFRFDCPPEDFERRWRAYFDLDTDYEAIQREAAGQDELLAHAAYTCRGLRILRQDPWETLVCFLISQRKSIPAIQTCVEALCTRCGAKVGRGRGTVLRLSGPGGPAPGGRAWPSRLRHGVPRALSAGRGAPCGGRAGRSGRHGRPARR